ncbi:hypothetical protein NB640_07370 [Oxalobacter vibrioformis]|uniref:Uncharacterized protein n=1 Tax=Oxalobacter vibrioformis TaxID=933080 RepID=A0A9E9P1R8_9BURK|nr:hypothetical protein [Oxalobacter vibrioformis]WAW09104.1 hypothetical protein NB640_07370 [Oxalobacter vibrioformis]
MRSIVINVEYGGLGDHLFHSPLPRLLKERKLAERVFISSESAYRNAKYFDFIWRNNPYLDGVSDAPATPIVYPKPKINKIMNKIASMYEMHGIDVELVPELYTKIDYNAKYADMDFVDLNYISFVGAFTILDKIKILKKYKNYYVLNPDYSILPFLGGRVVYTSSFNEYVSLIYSCRNLVCLTSGGATLMAAFKKPVTVFFGYGHPETNRHSMHQNIMIGGGGFFRKQLCRVLFKRNQLRIRFSKNK